MIQIMTASLNAAVLIAPTKDVRPYLNGVQIFVRDTGAVHVRATSGTMIFDDCGPKQSLLEGAEFIIPIAVAKELAKEKSRVLEFSLKDDGRWECADRLFAPLEGKFPNCDRVIPARSNCDRAENYDLELLALGQKAMRTARENSKGFYRVQNPEEAGGVGLICCENDDYPRIAIATLRAPRCFETQ